MKHRIDPTVDCVFKALLGSEENKNLLIHFLNAVLEPPSGREITWVELLNPYNEREYETDKLSVVDVKARDSRDVLYQIEIQLSGFSRLPPRILFTWSDIYAGQLESGHDYLDLKPVISIWVLDGILLQGSPACHHHFRLYDPAHDVVLSDHCAIHVLELPKWDGEEIANEKERWIWFFKEGKHLDDSALPPQMHTPEMRQAMETLRRFSEKQREYDIYQRRMDYVRQQRALERELQEARVARETERKAKIAALEAREAERKAKIAALEAREAERKAKIAALEAREAERKEKEAALQEKERLLALLKEAGIEP